MKVSKKTELVIAIVLVAYLAFTPGFQIVRTLLSSPLGKAAGLLGIVYVWKYVSKLIAVLLLAGYIRCAKDTNVWEGLAMPPVACTCDPGFKFDETDKKCRNDKGVSKDPVACSCPSGYTFDGTKKECVESSSMSEPIAPPVVTPPPGPVDPASMAAPAVSGAPSTGTAPETTPGAAQDMAANTPPAGLVQGPTPSESFQLMNAYPVR
jgi:hypothetical protein